MNFLFLNNFDQRAITFLAFYRSVLGIKIFEIITFFGNWQFLLPLMFVILYILFIKNKKEFIIPFFLTVFSAEAVTFFAKIFFQRARPLAAVFRETDFSFPSGHATIAVAFYGYLAYILTKLLPDKYKWPVIVVAILMIVLIGFSRLYLGVHYSSDVLAGYLIGLSALIIIIIFTKRFILK